MITIRQKYDGLKVFLLPGVYNLNSEDLRLARRACEQLIAAIPKVSLNFDQEDDRRALLNQIKIIKKQLDEISTPTFTSQVVAPPYSNLYTLALDYLGDALRWQEIAALNNIDEPYLTEFNTLQLPVK